MIDDVWQKLLERIHSTVHGRNKSYSARFRTSDVVQESAIQLLKESDSSQNDLFDPPQAWLKKIGRGHASKLRAHHDAQKRTQQSESSSDETPRLQQQISPEDEAIQREMSTRMMLALAKLETPQRVILDRHFNRQERFAEIARQMERSPDWVAYQYQKAIKQLRIALSQSEPG